MDAIEVIIQRAQFTHWIFKLRAKQDTYKVHIISISQFFQNGAIFHL